MRSSSSSDEEVAYYFGLLKQSKKRSTNRNKTSTKYQIKITKEEHNSSKLKPLKRPRSFSNTYKDSNYYKNFRFRKRSKLFHGEGTSCHYGNTEVIDVYSGSSKGTEWDSESSPEENNNINTVNKLSPWKSIRQNKMIPISIRRDSSLPDGYKSKRSFWEDGIQIKTNNASRRSKTKITQTVISGQTNMNQAQNNGMLITTLPPEILLKILSYFSLQSLVHVISNVCRGWEILALDWTLWKNVESLRIENMIISTTKLKTLLRAIRHLRKLELTLRNDVEELFDDVFETNQNLEVLTLHRCYRSSVQLNILSQTVTAILKYCPKLKCITFTETCFHSKVFYKRLAKHFNHLERIKITCTTKSEMNVFVRCLSSTVPNMEFQEVPMMGKADGKQIYWGPILGLQVRPIPTSPFYQFNRNGPNPPNYAF